jgi:hypothetical protein
MLLAATPGRFSLLEDFFAVYPPDLVSSTT